MPLWKPARLNHLIKNYFLNLVPRTGHSIDSIQITDPYIIEKFLSKPDFPFLISFPRTGSHWLRMIMELYFEKPSLVRIFYHTDALDFTCYHRHDEDLSIERENVIYLYRYPVDTIYSQLNYYRESIYDRSRIAYWSELYGKHLSKWLIEETFSKKKTLLTYEGMKRNIGAEFEKIARHFSVRYDAKRLESAVEKVSKKEVKTKTAHDRQVINLSRTYENQKESFREKYGPFVMQKIFEQQPVLKEFF